MKQAFLYVLAISLNLIEAFKISYSPRCFDNRIIDPNFPTKRRQSSLSISMHMGHSHTHSHSHEDHDDDDDHDDHAPKFDINSSVAGVRGGPSSQLGNIVSTARSSSKARILLISFLFLVPIMIRRRLTKLDLSALAVLATSLSFFDSAKRSFRRGLTKIKKVQQSLLKHTTPLTRKYFFKNENSADRVTLLGVLINVILSVIKLGGGIMFNSAVLVADAGHSLSDLFSDFITLWAVQIARLPADEDHPYGHGKFEAVGSLFLSLTLLGTGVGVGTWSYDRMLAVLQSSQSVQVVLPSWPALLLAAFSIGAKEWLFRVTKRVGDALNSQVIIANAWHHRSDAFSSILSLVSIAAAITLPGLVVADSAAGILIAGMICVTGLEVLIESVKQLTDTSDSSLVLKIEKLTSGIDGVREVKAVRTRTIGSGSLVDLTLIVEQKISSSVATAISEKVRWKIIEEIPSIMDVMVRTIASTEKICPLLVSIETRSVSDIEKQVREFIIEDPEVTQVPKIIIHYVNNAFLDVEAVIKVADEMSMKSAKEVGRRIRKMLLEKTDINQVDVYIDCSMEIDI